MSPSNQNLYEVDDGKKHSVNLETLSCTCKEWNTTKIACIHVVKVCEDTGRSVINYCCSYFKRELWSLAYAESINPVPDDDMPLITSSTNKGQLDANEGFTISDDHQQASQQTFVLLPDTRPRPRRPKRKRIESQEEPK